MLNFNKRHYNNICCIFRQDLEVPTSYVQGLINRIINNVCIVCNNVILKYVEDDIVLSINIKTLEFRSVDGNWTPAFIGESRILYCSFITDILYTYLFLKLFIYFSFI